MSLSARIIGINGVLFAVGIVLLAVTPVTVSARPVLSEIVVLGVVLLAVVAANGALVRNSLRPLDVLVADLDHVRSVSPLGRVRVPAAGIGRGLADAVNDLVMRIEAGQQQGRLAELAGQEAERARVAQELHDGVGQSLTALLLELGALADQAPPELRARVTLAREAARSGLDEIRGVARQLRPHVLEDLGLRSALAALTTELFGHGDTLVRRGVAPGLPKLDEAVELVVYRVAQEALTNVARHAGATTVELTLGRQGDRLRLSVDDDGRGLPPDADGTGLRGMRERAALVRGDLAVGRRDGGGTSVTLTVPL